MQNKQTNNCKTATKYTASQGKHLEVEIEGTGNFCQLYMNTVICMDSKMGEYVNFSNIIKFNRRQKCMRHYEVVCTNDVEQQGLFTAKNFILQVTITLRSNGN
jgi:hypothetical protein